MQLFPLTDPRSFGLPVLGSGLIILLVLVLLSTKWMNTEPVITKVPKHINARLVQVKKAVPKKTIKKVKKKKPKKVKAVKKPAPKFKKVVITKKVVKKVEVKKTIKPLVKKKSLPKPIPLPDSDLFSALEEEEQNNNVADLLSKELLLKQADEEQEAIMSYSGQIKALVESVWRTPPSAKHDDELILRIFLVPTGEVIDVQMVTSSGNQALDRSAEQAVWKVVQFPVPKDLILFEKEFRQFKLKLQPSTARL
ncbi:MAG: TonB family protein [Bermanella sp.]